MMVPAAAKYAKLTAVTNGAYDGYFDDIQFEKSLQARGFNFLDNSSFEKQSPEPSKWSSAGGNTSMPPDADSYSGSYDAQINQPSSGSSYFESQSVLPMVAGQSYTLTGFMKTGSITGGGGRFHILVSDSSGHLTTEPTTSYVTTQNTNWTKYVLAFQSPVNGTAKLRLESTAIGLVKFDNIRFSQGNYTVTNQYDANKNYLTGSADQLGHTTGYVNDSYGQATSVTSPGGEKVQYSYDGQEQLRTVTDNAGTVTTYVLDNNGNVLSTSLAAGTTTYDTATFTYNPLDNLLSEKDAELWGSLDEKQLPLSNISKRNFLWKMCRHQLRTY